MKRDYKTEAWQLHTEFHKYLKPIRIVLKGPLVNDLDKLHDLFDKLAFWVGELYDENLKLQGALEIGNLKKDIEKARNLIKDIGTIKTEIKVIKNTLGLLLKEEARRKGD